MRNITNQQSCQSSDGDIQEKPNRHMIGLEINSYHRPQLEVNE